MSVRAVRAELTLFYTILTGPGKAFSFFVFRLMRYLCTVNSNFGI